MTVISKHYTNTITRDYAYFVMIICYRIFCFHCCSYKYGERGQKSVRIAVLCFLTDMHFNTQLTS